MKTYFIDVIKNHYADFSGKATRKQYWLFFAWWIIIYIAITLVFIFVPPVALILLGLLSLIVLIPAIAIFVRRVRDTGHSPYWGLLLIPNLLTVISGFLPRTLVENQAIVFMFFLVAILSILCGIGVLIFALLPSKK